MEVNKIAKRIIAESKLEFEYKVKRKAIDKLLVLLNKELKDNDETFSRNYTDYGFLGNLEVVFDNLNETVRFLKGEN